jgi:hypothetical protein
MPTTELSIAISQIVADRFAPDNADDDCTSLIDELR